MNTERELFSATCPEWAEYNTALEAERTARASCELGRRFRDDMEYEHRRRMWLETVARLHSASCAVQRVL